MPETDEKLSPEEKLLRVIQGGEKQGAEGSSDTSGVAPADAATSEDTIPAVTVATVAAPPPEPKARESAPAEPPRSEVARKPKLALAKPDKPEPGPQPEPGGAAKAKPAAKAKGRRRARTRPAVAAATPSKKDVRPVGGGLQTVNKCLAGIILLVLLLTGWEIMANASAVSKPIVAAAIDLPPTSDDGARELVPLDEVLDAISKRPIFQTVKIKQKPPIGPRGENPLKSAGLLGISQADGENEGIVQDRETDKMYFLHVGDKFTMKNTEYTVLAVEADRLRVTDGERETDIK